MTDFKKLNLHPTILESLKNKGYQTPTPIQLEAIPHLLEEKDLLGIAQTGTGKTAAFLLPILNNLSSTKKLLKPNNVRALILVPTRELASQIAENLKIYSQGLNITHTAIFGGINERIQIKAMARGVDILIATPGRLLDLIGQNQVKFTDLEIFVLDEADRMLDMGFINDVKKIITKLPSERHSLFFSATMPAAIVKLANLILKDPITVEITPESTTVEKIDQRINFVDQSHKKSLLKTILAEEGANKVLVFSKTKHGANKIVEFLVKETIKVTAIHGNKSQEARQKALNNFRNGDVQVLVATDIAARGIDVPGITHIINFDIPNDPESYVHRIGRTARAGKEGIAISFCSPGERKLLAAVEKVIKIRIPVDRNHPYQDAAPIADSSKTNSKPVKKARDSSDYSRSNETRRRDNFKSENSANNRKPFSHRSENKREFTRDQENNGNRRFQENSRGPRSTGSNFRNSEQRSKFPRQTWDNNKSSSEDQNYNSETPSFSKVRGRDFFRSEENSKRRFNNEGTPRGSRFDDSERSPRSRFGNEDRTQRGGFNEGKPRGTRFGGSDRAQRGGFNEEKPRGSRFGNSERSPRRFGNEDRPQREGFNREDRPRFNDSEKRERPTFRGNANKDRSNYSRNNSGKNPRSFNKNGSKPNSWNKNRD